MSDFRRLTLAEAAARIRVGVNTLILFHRYPDGDAVGAGFALKLLLEEMGCRVYCSCDDPIPERLRFLTDDRESVVADQIPADFLPAQILTVDSASPAQVGAQYARYEGRIDLMIDHHAKGETYADGYIDGDASSAGELIYRLSRELVRTGRISAIPEGVDRLLYAAISSDTGCFRYSNASPATHRAIAELLEANDLDAADINHRLFGVKSYKLLQAEKVGFDRLRLYADGKLGIVDMPFDVVETYGFTDEDLGTLVDVARGLSGVQVAVAIRQPASEWIYRVSMRSSCHVDVASVCAEFGGGGHVKAAGCTVTCEGGMEEVVRMIAEAVTPVL